MEVRTQETGMKLRPYQEKAVESVFNQWQGHDSTLLVMATGTGKTVVFSEIVRRIGGRALVIAHREELIWQAVQKLRGIGMEANVEMADLVADANFWDESPVVVSTVQTQSQRMTRFDPYRFELLVIDEAHHATASTYRKTIDYYRQNTNLKILGVTATPDRADKEALGQVFQSVALDYEILDAIKDGFLVPIEQQLVVIEGLDFSSVRTTAGDLNGADLALVMEAEKNLHGIVSATLDIIGERKTIVFAVTVKQAEMYSEIFNRHKPGMSDWVCGKTPKDKRREIFRKFGTGETQILVNVGILTEGYDNPSVEVIAMARPTKSRCLYSQMVGRGTRTLPGVIDQSDDAEERRNLIAQSQKASCLVIDFVGNAGKHKLMTTADILGGKVSQLAVQRVLQKAKGKALDMIQALEEEEAKLRAEIEERKRREMAKKAHIVGVAEFSTKEISPFDIFHLEPPRVSNFNNNRILSPGQSAMLRRNGIDPNKITPAQGHHLCGEIVRRIKERLCSFKQAKLLKKHGYETKNLTMQDASKLIDALAKNNWRRPEAA
jgi:superfamily II DNA or RNA helicase